MEGLEEDADYAMTASPSVMDIVNEWIDSDPEDEYAVRVRKEIDSICVRVVVGYVGKQD